MNGNTLYIRSKNNDSTTVPTYATEIKFYCNTDGKVVKNIFILGPSSATLYGGLNLSGTNAGLLWSDITNQAYFTQTYHNAQTFNILSRNDYYSGSPLATSINFYCYDTAKVQKNPMVINPSSVNITGSLNVSSSFQCDYIPLNPVGNGASIIFPSSIPSTSTGHGGLGITWNGSGGGRTDLIGYGQGGAGGFSFSSASAPAGTTVKTQLYIDPSTITMTVPLTLQTTYASAPSSTQLGYSVAIGSGYVTITNNTNIDMTSGSGPVSIPTGVWIVHWNIFISFTTSGSYNAMEVGFSTTTTVGNYISNVGAFSYSYSTENIPATPPTASVMNSSFIYTNTTGSNVSLYVPIRLNILSGGNAQGKMNGSLTRIA